MPTASERADRIHRRWPWVVGGICIGALIVFWFFRTSTPTLDQVEASFVLGDDSQARLLAERIVQRKPSDEAAWFWLGRICERQRDFEAAARAYEQSHHAQPAHRESRERQAFCLLQSGRLGDAEAVYRQLLDERPMDEAVQTELQWLYFNQLRERELEIHLERALELEPGSFRILYHLLYSSQRRPNPREAVGRLELAYREHPDQAAVKLALGRCYWMLGKSAEARELLDAARRDRPDDPETLLAIAEFELEQNSLEAASEILTRLQSTLKNDDRWWWLNGQIEYRHQATPAGADEDPIDASKISPTSAIRCLEKAVQLRPQEIRYIQTLATWHQAAGSTDEAAKFHAEVQRLSDANRELYTIVSRGDLEHPSAELFRTIAGHLDALNKPQQARGWRAADSMRAAGI